MTLSVAAYFPWGRLKQRVKGTPGATLEQAAILATDSRFGFIDADPFDSGKKLYVLTGSAALIFAGDVRAAQVGIRGVQRYLKTKQALKQEPNGPIGAIFRQAYTRELQDFKKGNRIKPNGLHVLIGTCSPSGRAGITRFSSRANFHPVHLVGVEGVGWPSDIETFNESLLSIEAQRWEEQHVTMDPNPWHIDVVAALNTAIASPTATPTIGGLVQSVIVTKRGIFESEMSSVGPDDDPMNASAWRVASVRMDDVVPWGDGMAEPAPESGLTDRHVIP